MGRLDLPNRYNVGADLLDRNLEAGRGNKIAIFSAAGDLTYLDLFKLSNGAAHALHDLGVRREERVLIAAYDGPGWVAATQAKGYREEADVDAKSETETFVAARLVG